jgi:hypothetical protein
MMKKIDQFNSFMGKASIDITEILLLPLKDLRDLFSVIFLYLVLVFKFLHTLKINSKKQFLEKHGDDYKLTEILFHQIKYFFTSFIDLNKKFLISIFFEASKKQPLIPLFFTVGFISWVWFAIKVQSVLMGIAALIPIFMIFTCPMGIWYLIFGVT